MHRACFTMQFVSSALKERLKLFCFYRETFLRSHRPNAWIILMPNMSFGAIFESGVFDLKMRLIRPQFNEI